MRAWDQNDPSTRRLLEKFKPHIYIAPDSYLPLNFYRDYLPNCVARTVDEPSKVLHGSVDRKLLNKIKYTHDIYLDYLLSAEEALTLTTEGLEPTAYGRIYTDWLELEEKKMKLVFLKYSLVFPYSGLPSEIGFWKKLGSSIAGNPKGWHELDIHGAIHIVLAGDNLVPIGILLAQHNHHRVFLRDRDFTWPADNRVSISIAQYSNEPYLLPLHGEFHLELTVGNPLYLEYLFGVSDDVPLTAGLDKIYSKNGGARKISLRLELLPLDDALYTAWIPMGDRTRIFGIWQTWYMRGPPGIDFYTFGPLKNLSDLMAFWFVNPQDHDYFNLVRDNFKSFDDYDFMPMLSYQKKKLFEELTLTLFRNNAGRVRSIRVDS
jgi:hypothetical protein